MSDKLLIAIKDIDKILAELKRQGNNLNQATRYANETGFADKLNTAIEYNNKLYREIINVLKESW
ncbi:hypothetical protein FACS1894188_05190 [Clostridia bacterium]|nr:hypothetical protein FACS1894188_05190 [Clostridia bacterium]